MKWKNVVVSIVYMLDLDVQALGSAEVRIQLPLIPLLRGLAALGALRSWSTGRHGACNQGEERRVNHYRLLLELLGVNDIMDELVFLPKFIPFKAFQSPRAPPVHQEPGDLVIHGLVAHVRD